jgi:hypothetical protein
LTAETARSGLELGRHLRNRGLQEVSGTKLTLQRGCVGRLGRQEVVLQRVQQALGEFLLAAQQSGATAVFPYSAARAHRRLPFSNNWKKSWSNRRRK